MSNMHDLPITILIHKAMNGPIPYVSQYFLFVSHTVTFITFVKQVSCFPLRQDIRQDKVILMLLYFSRDLHTLKKLHFKQTIFAAYLTLS